MAFAVRIACVCQPCDGPAAMQHLPLLPSLRSWPCPTLSLKNETGIYNVVYSNQRELRGKLKVCKTFGILNCFLCESHAVMGGNTAKGQIVRIPASLF